MNFCLFVCLFVYGLFKDATTPAASDGRIQGAFCVTKP
jgi:hypothetical protein